MATEETRERLLDTAERHFSEQGFAGASLRAITRDARANLAAVSYHFGSKEDLFVAVVARRLDPINRERLRLFDEAEARAGGRALEVETILEVMILPVLREGSDGPCVLRMFGRANADADVPTRRIVEGPMREVRARVHQALRRALPKLSERELAYRMHFTLGAVKSVASDQHLLRAMSDGRCDPSDLEGTARHLIPFLAAGMQAKAPRIAVKSTRKVRS